MAKGVPHEAEFETGSPEYWSAMHARLQSEGRLPSQQQRTEEMSLACQHGRCHLCTDFDGWGLGPCSCVCHIPDQGDDDE